MSKDTTNYGSIEEGDKSFDTTQMQYLGEGKPLTKEEKIRKFIRVGVPLVLSALIVMAAVFFLLKDFTHLYPGRGSHSKTMVTEDGSSSLSSSSTTTVTAAHHASIPTSAIDSKCSAHDACGGLTGNCCPTNDGFFLDCCN